MQRNRKVSQYDPFIHNEKSSKLPVKVIRCCIYGKRFQSSHYTSTEQNLKTTRDAQE